MDSDLSHEAIARFQRLEAKVFGEEGAAKIAQGREPEEQEASETAATEKKEVEYE
jgi:hypothetical protein